MQKKIFVIEDDPGIIEVVTIILEDYGYRVVTAMNGEELEKALTKHIPDLILMDIWLGGERGEELTSKLKGNGKTKHIPIIVISANNETKKIASLAGADDFLLKPFDITDLIEIVEKYLT